LSGSFSACQLINKGHDKDPFFKIRHVFNSYGDISAIAKYPDCLDELGASGTGAHRAGETINLKEYTSSFSCDRFAH